MPIIEIVSVLSGALSAILPEQFTFYDPSISFLITLLILAVVLVLIVLAVVCCRKLSGNKKQEYIWHGKETDWKFV